MVKPDDIFSHTTGSIQLFLNTKLEVRYARTRHYSKINKDSKKPQFTYCRINDLEQLKTLLSNKPITHITNTPLGQSGQTQNQQPIDQNNAELSSKVKNMADPMGFEPMTFSLEG